jgi:serine/threonine protein kinase
VNHPNAVSVLDFNVSSTGIAYLVMELLEGRTLAGELREKGRLSPARCAQILLPVCDALNKAHSAGIVHRDIKPDNIFLHQTREGEVVKVVDFGIAKLLGETNSLGMNSLTATGGLLGTPAYMSPERLANDPYDGRADVYSLGILLYQMLSGSIPYKSSDGSFWAIVVMHLKEQPQPLRKINPSIPEEVEAVVMHAMEKDPKKRPTAKELAQEFAMAVGIQLSVLSSGSFKFKLNDQITASGEISTLDLAVQETAAVPVIKEETIDDKNPLTGEITVIYPKK